MQKLGSGSELFIDRIMSVAILKASFEERVCQSQKTLAHFILKHCLIAAGFHEEDMQDESIYCLVVLLSYAKYLGQIEHQPIAKYPTIPRETLYTQILGKDYRDSNSQHRQYGADLFKAFIEPMLFWGLEGARTVTYKKGPILYKKVLDEYKIDRELWQGLFTSEQRSAGLAEDNIPKQCLGYSHSFKGHSRQFYIKTIVEILDQQFDQIWSSPFFVNTLQRFIQDVASDQGINSRQNPLDSKDFKHRDRLPAVVYNSARIIQASTYRLDQQWLVGGNFAAAIRENPLSLSQKLWLLKSLSELGTQSGIQYHPTVILQRPGRLGTRGGIIGLPKWIRHRLVRPVDDNHVLVELDLCCAQLLLAAKILKLDSLVQQILDLLDSSEKISIWPYIGPRDLDKRVKKVVVYGLVFGAELKNLRKLANEETTTHITQKIIKDILGCKLLSPLVQAREDFLTKIANDVLQGKKQEPNELGINLNGNRYLRDAIAEVKQRNKLQQRDLTVEECCQNAARRVARQVAAHYMQGAEQAIIQPLMIELERLKVEEQRPYYLNCYSYDGLTYAMPPENVEEFMVTCQTWLLQNHPDSRLELEVIENQCCPLPSES
ncbi:hypothetical protein VZH09_13825 (plasmid) [Synechococcus elongatus IITB7]|uniref:hypothetical protein n=1 Tax=Synechococcus elongatus TaxID=32046 RepID=UPI0030CB6D01